MARSPDPQMQQVHADDGFDLPEIASGQLVLDLHHEPSQAEADFLVWDGNRLAYQHVMAFPGWTAPLSLIVGPAKTGKSHLANIWTGRANAIAARPADLERLAGEGGIRPVLIESADLASAHEEGLFHLLNQSMREQRPVLMTARQTVGQWDIATDDVRSRVRLASQFNVESADDTQLSQMFVKLFGDRQVLVDPKLISYLLPRMERSPQEAVALVALIDQLALSRRSPVTRAVAAEALTMRDKLRSGEPEKMQNQEVSENG